MEKPIIGKCADCKKPIFWITNKNGVMTGYSVLPTEKKKGTLHPCQAKRKMEGKKWKPAKRH